MSGILRTSLQISPIYVDMYSINISSALDFFPDEIL